MPVQPPLLVLIIEDDPDTRANFADILELDGFQVETAGTEAEALHRTDWSRYTAIILDYRLPDGNAENLLPKLCQLAPNAGIIIATGTVGLSGAILALRYGAADFILKPIDADALRASLARIAERQRLRGAKEHSEAAFRTLVEAAPCLIVMLKPDFSVAYFNSFAKELTGYSTEEVLGKNFFQVFLPDAYQPLMADEFQRVLAGTPSRGYENPALCKDGSQGWIVWNAQRLDDYEGGPAILAVGQDITKVKVAQEKALQSERLAAIGQMVTGLAHESGNALARSRACLDMLSWEVEDRPAALDLIQRIRQAQDHLQQLYEEVRGYAAPLKLDREVWNLSGIWRQAWKNLALLREGKEAYLLERTEGVNLECSVDQFRIEQVFRNILENALAACPNPIRIEIFCSEEEWDGRSILRIAVRDNGPGLTSEQKQRIFDPFFTTKTKGTGLGMAIAKRIMEAHGGGIAVGAGTGQGAEIVITLPRESV
jgi:two-component system, LuxR family, sensor kinase FixL